MGQGQSSGTSQSGRRRSTVRRRAPPMTPVRLTGDSSAALTEHTKPVLCCAFSPDEKLVLTGSADKKAIVWSLSTRKPISRMTGHSDAITGCAFIDDNRVVTTSRDGSALVWMARTDTASRPTGQRYSNHEGPVLACSVSSDGEHIATCSEDRTAQVWLAARTHGPPATLIRGHSAAVLDCKFSPDDAFVCTCAQDNTIRLWNRRSGKVISELRDAFGPVGVCFSPDGVYISVASDDNMLRIWNVNSEEVVNGLSGHTAPLTGCDFNMAGDLLASSSKDTHIRLWNPRDVAGKSVKTLAGHTGEVLCCTFSPSGRFLATTADDNTCRIWR